MHVGFMVAHNGNFDLLLHPNLKWPIQVGRFAAVFVLLIMGISLGRKLIPINNKDWRWLHGVFAWGVLTLSLVHCFAIGSSGANGVVLGIWIVYFVVALACWFKKPSRKSSASN